MRRAEDNLQAAVVAWFRLQHPGRLIWATPNAGKRSIRQIVAARRTGLVAGVPDLLIPEPVGDKHGLFIELKTGRNSVTAAQQAMIDALRVRGYACHVCYTLEEFMSVVKCYFRPRD